MSIIKVVTLSLLIFGFILINLSFTSEISLMNFFNDVLRTVRGKFYDFYHPFQPRFQVGAQLVIDRQGPYTGIPMFMGQAKAQGLNYALVWHSETKDIYVNWAKTELIAEGEEVTEDKIHQKVYEIANRQIRKMLDIGMSPVLCVGEEFIDRAKDKQFEVIQEQIENILLNGKYKFSDDELLKIEIFYEPIWAIQNHEPTQQDLNALTEQDLQALIDAGYLESGTTLESLKLEDLFSLVEKWKAQEDIVPYAEDIVRAIYKKIRGNAELTDEEIINDKITVGYGGSSNSGNAESLLHNGIIKGLLPGSASKSKEEVLSMVPIASRYGAKIRFNLKIYPHDYNLADIIDPLFQLIDPAKVDVVFFPQSVTAIEMARLIKARFIKSITAKPALDGLDIEIVLGNDYKVSHFVYFSSGGSAGSYVVDQINNVIAPRVVASKIPLSDFESLRDLVYQIDPLSIEINQHVISALRKAYEEIQEFKIPEPVPVP